ncbi:endonuclease/exonuclease/phosphatase family protein [Parasphingorhabdus sp.]|uniref:endonuclease/exonuclease/phosphatase family protein n=1 Tax=Parasphingorhabdus sp. TaxID=2709688 RepID=UPI0030036F70
MLKVASYNIHKGIGTDRRRNPGRIIDVLNEIDADIIALQEADRRFGARAAAIPEKLLEMHSDYRAIPLDVQIDSMGWHGNALLVRKSAEVVAHDIMHIPCLEPRGAIMGHFEIDGRQLAVFGMHLDLSGLWRRRQAAAIVKLAQQKEQDVPVVLMGDLNEWSAAGGCLKDFSRAFDMVDCGRSFHSRSPIATLDRIMHSRAIRAQAAGVHDSPSARKASDHLPVWAELAVG